MTEEFIAGRNSILEALHSGRSINRIFVAKGDRQGSIVQILALAKEKGLVIQEVEKAKVDALIEQGIKDGTLNGFSEQWLKAPLPASLGV